MQYNILSPDKALNYAELLMDVVSKTDQENWDYFSEDALVLAKDFLEYGYFSRVITVHNNETNDDIAIGYVQLRILKKTAPQLLYKDLYHTAGLSGMDLWEKSDNLKTGMPVYVDVIAIKKSYQNNLKVLTLVAKALQELFTEIGSLSASTFDIYAVGVTDAGCKMCKLMKMTPVSTKLRREGANEHVRVLYKSSVLEMAGPLLELIKR